ncbi:PH domain-containing protein [Streptomyces sp. WMMB 714]|uniref:PH domain-containing protein n=1 Tax=Streptomyces sp. WMMB 714 TaxID=1286822 RepID=UPI00099C9AB2
MTTGTGRPGGAPEHGRGQRPDGGQAPVGGDPGQTPGGAPGGGSEGGSEGHSQGGSEGGGAPERWQGVERALLKVRRLVLLFTMAPAAVGLAALLGLTAGPGWAAFALLPLVVAAWGWGAIERNWRSWRYAEREDDLLISRGVLWRELTVVPYGRMQLVEVTSGPLERRYGLARLQLHTAAATTDAAIPGLVPQEAERLRDRLTELGGARSAGL